MGNDEHHMALPKLYGAPAYARPAAPVVATPKPFDPDDLPLETYLTEEERGALLRAPGADLRRWRRGRPRRDIRRWRSRGLADAARPALPPRLDHVAHPRRRRELLGGLTPPAPASSDRSWGSSSIGQSGGLISRWFQVRVLAPLPPRRPPPGSSLAACNASLTPRRRTARRANRSTRDPRPATGRTRARRQAGPPGPAQPRRRPMTTRTAATPRPAWATRRGATTSTAPGSGPTERGAARSPTPAAAGTPVRRRRAATPRRPRRPGSRSQRPAGRPAGSAGGGYGSGSGAGTGSLGSPDGEDVQVESGPGPQTEWLGPRTARATGATMTGSSAGGTPRAGITERSMTGTRSSQGRASRPAPAGPRRQRRAGPSSRLRQPDGGPGAATQRSSATPGPGSADQPR